VEAVLSPSRCTQVNIVHQMERTGDGPCPLILQNWKRIFIQRRRGLPHASAWVSFRCLRGKVPSTSSLARQPVKPPPMVNLNSIHNKQEHFHTDYTVTVEPGSVCVVLYSCQANRKETIRGCHWSAQIDDISYHPFDSDCTLPSINV
jgi:hypothetical protein